MITWLHALWQNIMAAGGGSGGEIFSSCEPEAEKVWNSLG